MRPARHRHRLPMAERFQTEVEQPFRFAFYFRDVAHHVFVQTDGNHVGVNVGNEAVFVLASGDVFQQFLVALLFLFILIVVVVHYCNEICKII